MSVAPVDVGDGLVHHLQEQRRVIDPMLAAQGLQRITQKHDLLLVHPAYAGLLARLFPEARRRGVFRSWAIGVHMRRHSSVCS